MVKVTFKNIVSGAFKSGVTAGKSKESLRWFSMYARNFSKLKGPDLLKGEVDNLQQQLPPVGTLCMYTYDPKWKAKLPYYDRLPCIFVLEKYADGSWLGINFHYLNLNARIALMDALYSLENNAKIPANKKLLISYQILKSASRYRWFKPAIKKYLPGHVRSRFLKVPYEYWSTAIFLPIQSWDGSITDRNKIYSNSAKVYNK